MLDAPTAPAATPSTAPHLAPIVRVRRKKDGLGRPLSLGLLKPAALERRVAWPILVDLIGRGLEPAALRLVAACDRRQAAEHYAAHAGADYFERLLDSLCSGPLLAVAWARADGACPVATLRQAMGPYAAPRRPGTIRGDYMRPGDPPCVNLIHGSDSPQEADRELELWFPGGV